MNKSAPVAVVVVAMAAFWIAASVMDYAAAVRGSLWDALAAGITGREILARLFGAIAFGAAAWVSVALLRRCRTHGYVQSEEGCRAILDEINDAVFIHDIETGHVLDVNGRACAMYGYEHDEMCFMDVGALSSSKEPYTTEFAQRWMRKALTEGPQVFEWLAKDRQGRLFWTEVNLKAAVIEGATRLIAVVRDITKHKAAEDAFEESERKYRTAFNVSPVAIGLIGKDGRIVEINGRLPEWLGLGMADMMGRSIRDLPFMTDADRSRMMAAFARRIHGDEVPPYEVSFVAKDGRAVLCEIHAEAMSDARGEVICEMVMAVDISARRAAQSAVFESEKKYRAVFEASPAAIVMLDTKGFVLDVNARVLDWLGFAPEDIRGRHLLRIPVMDMSARILAFKSLFKRMRGKDVPPYEIEFICKNGQRRRGLIHATVLRGEGGRITGDLVLISDITESKRAEEALRRSEENYRRLFEQSSDAIFIHDLKGNISDVNGAACAMLGYARDTLLRLAIADLHPQDQLDASQRGFDSVKRDGMVRFESKFVRADGGIIDVDISSRLVDRETEMVQGVVRDITARVREQEKLKDALEFKSEMLTTVSHELGAPLTSIADFVEQVLREDRERISEHGKELLRRIRGSARQLMVLIGNLLDASRIDAGRVRLARQPFSLAAAVNDCVDNMEGMIRGRQVALVKRMDKADVPMLSDRAKIDAIVTNVVSNAINFTEKGEVAIEAGPADDRPGWVRIRVSDTGIGIPRDKMEKIFRKFTQLRDDRFEHHHGTGLGLYIVKQYVDRLGGEIDMTSEPGIGTTVTVLLPIIIPEPDESSSGDGPK